MTGDHKRTSRWTAFSDDELWTLRGFVTATETLIDEHAGEVLEADDAAMRDEIDVALRARGIDPSHWPLR